jgi:hypothetical protein
MRTATFEFEGNNYVNIENSENRGKAQDKKRKN